MPFFRSLLILGACSLLAGAGLFSLARASGNSRPSGAYAVLAVNAEIPDLEIRRRLEEKKLAAGLVSESTQWFFLDVFNGIERIPLNEYSSRLLPSDPRADGYAEKLCAFFVRGGKRFLFIPAGSFHGVFEKKIGAALQGIPFSLEYLGGGNVSPVFSLPLFACAAAGLFLLRLRGTRRTGELFARLPVLPVLFPLALSGAAGFALTSALCGVWELLREPLHAFFTALRYSRARRHSGAKQGAFFFREAVQPYRFFWLFSLPCLAAGFVCAFVLALPVPLALGASAGFLALAAGSEWAFSLRGASAGHIRFFPAPLTRPGLKPRLFALMLPFALAAGLAAIASALPGFSQTAGATPGAVSLLAESPRISEEEYLSHVEFQRSFSGKALGRPDSGYPSFAAGADGLVIPVEKNSPPGTARVSGAELPPFPLKRLMGLLESGLGQPALRSTHEKTP